MRKYGYLLFFLLITSGYYFFYFLSPVNAQTETVCNKAIVNVVFRGENGNYLSNIPFEIYEQTTDVDGQAKPGKKVASGKTSAITGAGTVSFKPGSVEGYAVKAWEKNSTVGEFYFFDNLSISACEDTVEIDSVNYLSGVKTVFRDIDGNLRKNIKFSVYTQREDIDRDPIKEKQDLVANFDTSEEGVATIYLADDSRTLAGKTGGRYIFSLAGKNGGEFIAYDITLSDGRVHDFIYVFSVLSLKLRDSKNNLFPDKSKIEMFAQTENSDHEKKLGRQVGTIYTDEKGEALWEYPAGIYAARILGGNGDYQYFWDLEISDQKFNPYELSMSDEWVPDKNTCSDKSKIDIVLRDVDNNIIPNMNIEIFEKNSDINDNPIVGIKTTSAKTDISGKAHLEFNPDPRKEYILKVYDKDQTTGAFWYYHDLNLACNENKTIEKKLSYLNVILRKADGSLWKNANFSLYLARNDIDGKPIKEKSDLIANLNTGNIGQIKIFLSDANEKSQKNKYIFSALGANKAEYLVYDISPESYIGHNFEYILSDLKINIKNAVGAIKVEFPFEIYVRGNTGAEQTRILQKGKTDKMGDFTWEYAPGRYELRLKDDLGQYYEYPGLTIKPQARSSVNIATNLTKIYLVDNAGNKFSSGAVTIYSMKEENGSYYKDKSLKTVKTDNRGLAELSLAPRPYLFAITLNKKEYGEAFYVNRGKLDTIKIVASGTKELYPDSKFNLQKPAAQKSIAEKLKGRILLQVENRGEAWYVNPADATRYYLQDGLTAFSALRKFGVGVTDANLGKIAIGADSRFMEFDYDGDGISDKMEEALGLDMRSQDSDRDGYSDSEEIVSGFNPQGSGKLNYDQKFSKEQAGRILLQVESRGEAWYINPSDNKRYYMQNGEMAYQIMRFLSLGISNQDLSEIDISN